MSFRKIGLVFSPLLLCFLPLGQASAQGSGADAFAIEEIVVTARRREESLQDTPIAVTAYSEDEMDLRGHLNITDISQSTPNVNIEQAASVSGLSAAPTVFIRGVGQLDFVINTDPAVGVYVDGVYIARSIGSMMDLMDLERAEVLRGPQGTLFGRNTLAGALNLISRRPTMDEFDAKLTLAAGENGYAQFNGAFNIPIADNLAARVSLMQRQKGGYVRANPDFYDDLWLGDDNTTGFRGQLEFLPSDTVRVNLSADYTRSRAAPAPMIALTLGDGYGQNDGGYYPDAMSPIFWNGGLWMGMFMAGASREPACQYHDRGGQLLEGDARFTNPTCYGPVHFRGKESYETTAVFYDIYGEFDPDPTNEVDVTGGAATIEVDTAIGTFKSITAYRGFLSNFRNDHDYSAATVMSNINDDFHQDGRSQEFQLVGTALDGRLEYTTGLYAFAETGTEVVSIVGVNGLTVTRGSAGLSFQRVVRDIDNTSSALYGQITYHFEQPFHLTAGLRATEDSKGFDVTIHRDFCPDRPSDSAYPDYLGGTTCNGDGRISRDKIDDVFQRATGVASWSEVDPMLSLAYDLNDTTMLYGTYATGFRDGGYASRFPEGMPDPIPAFDPEYVTSVEFGAKTELADGSLRLNAALFHTTYDDMQVSGRPADLASGATGVSNVGVGILDGLEMEAMWVVNDNLRIDATLGLLDASVDSLVGGSFTSGVYVFYEEGFVGADGQLLSAATCPANRICVPHSEMVLPYTPKTNYTVGVSHRLPIGTGNLLTRLDWIHNDAQRFRIETNPDMYEDAYNVVHASTTFNSGNDQWALTFGIRNATNAIYSTAGSFSTGIGASAVNVSRPREAYLRYQYWVGGR